MPTFLHEHRSVLSRLFVLAILLIGSLSQIGCSSYNIQGTVMAGPVPSVDWVDSDDRRINEPATAVPDAMIEVTVDPEGMHPTDLPLVYSDQNGHFSIPMDKLGADWMNYDLYIVCRAEGYETTTNKQGMPVFRGKVLITMMPGANHFIKPKDDSFKDSVKFKDQIYNGN